MDPQHLIEYLSQEKKEEDEEINIVIATRAQLNQMKNSNNMAHHVEYSFNHQVINRNISCHLIYCNYFSDYLTY